MEGKLRISYVANHLGVTPHYLRMLEWEGRIPDASYDRAGRFYTIADIQLSRAIGIGSKPRRLKTPDEVLG